MTSTVPSSTPGSDSTIGRTEGPILVVEDLTVTFPTEDGPVSAVQGLSYSVEMGKTLGIVGESGSGKSVSSMAVLGLHDAKSSQITGSIRIDGTEVVGLSENRFRKLRGNTVSMIFQDALAALHPFYKIGAQLAEAYQVHHPNASDRDARRKAIEMLDRVGIPQPDSRVDDFPHQFSGGMRQRAMIAMGLINDPSLLIADEPTTALDVTVQAQILDLLQDLQREFNSAVIIITHDLGVIAEMADDVLVMYAGRCVEYGTTKEILTHPEMPYTWGLLSSIPDISASTDARLIPIPGNPPSLFSPPTGCAFHPRCGFKDKVPGRLCYDKMPELATGSGRVEHLKRCHLANPDAIYRAEVLPEIAPDLVEEIR
ncbi:MAG: oppD 4 [Nocardioides sp.]|uniref:ABC transporter ATP-binding protein n=1 Tax=Nocardioides sp. TaxID=35761 RepID=UPI00260D9833|nr:ABC transporter ATP-binding protein [Nocardioides sp.]MCW2834519.1 oppD 4 [Nocardioides sp.]